MREADDDEPGRGETVAVFKTADSNLLPIVKSALDAAGIPYVVQGEEALGLLPMGPFAVGLNRRVLGAIVRVPGDRAAEALAYLKSFDEGAAAAAGYLIETERLGLRELDIGDLDTLATLFSDPEVMQHYPSTRNREETRKWIEQAREGYRDGFGKWGAELLESGRLIGYVALVAKQVDGKEEVEVGYLLSKDCWGQGLATEAARACRDYAFDVLGLPRVISIIPPANRASRRVAEKNRMKIERETVLWDKQVLIYCVHPSEVDRA